MKKLIFLFVAALLIAAKLSAQDSTMKTNHPVPKDTSGQSKTLKPPVIKQDTPGAQADKSTDQPCKFYPETTLRKVLGWGLIIVIIGGFLIMAFKSDILKDPITNVADFLATANATTRYQGQTDPNKIPKPYSLSRTQLAVWTAVISCAYVYLIIIEYFPYTDVIIDSSLLLLMGISAATAGGGSIIANSPDAQNYNGPSDGFFTDILSDKNGINLHRLQNVIWTIIAVCVFICKIPKTGCGHLPELDSTLIALTGISSATYLGLKVNENNKPTIPPTQGS